MNIIGLSAYYHDSAACLIKDGDIISAAQEERFSRKKHDSGFPINAINFCIKQGKLELKDIDYIVFYDKPFLKFERLLETYLAYAPKGFKSFSTSLPIWLKDKLFQKNVIANELKENFGDTVNWNEKLLFSEHHLSHAASAFFPSPFRNAAILTMDGVGEWSTTSLAIGTENNLEVHKEIHFPHSLGLLYSAFTFYTGFKVNSGEYKVMGLAPYGEPRYINQIKDNLIDIKEDGSFNLNMSYFNYCTGLTMTNNRFHELFNGPPRKSESLITKKEMDLAASIQAVTEEVVIKLAKGIKKTTKLKNLCLAGGVALNCVANGKLLNEKIFDKIWIQPACGDAGGAIGAALNIHYLMLKKPRIITTQDSMQGSFLGPDFTQKDIENRLDEAGAKYKKVTDKDLIEIAANFLSQGKVIGWHQGKMEFGPRSLGGRSILADPRSSLIQKQLNLKIKYRESFRPFAPSILSEEVSNWFELETESPYMLMVANIKKNKRIPINKKDSTLVGIDKLKVYRSKIPAVTHVDFSARIQTVHKKTNPKYHQLITKFKEITGCPILVNTSFNVRGEPVVCSPEDAFNCFMGTGIEVLIIGNCILEKKEQDQSLLKNYTQQYEPD
jgi:carbamoyltransferase